jgi:hypothetical protein
MNEGMYRDLMQIFSVPRPNGSRAERDTIARIRAWLEQQAIPYKTEPFSLYPYYFEILGIWLILSYLALAVAVFYRTGLWATLIALAALLGSALSFVLKIHLITWIGRKTGHNFVLRFPSPQAQTSAARCEVVISAHYDSKSEPLDHRQRMFFLKSLQVGIFVSLAIAAVAPVDRWLLTQGSTLAGLTYILGIGLSLSVIILASGFGLNLALSRLAPQSFGAVDNGTSCAVVLGLAERLAKGAPLPAGTQVTLALFAGEEVDRQGSRAYVRRRGWEIPAYALNLEVLAQNGDYVYWELDGSVFRLRPTDIRLNHLLRKAVEDVTGAPPRAGGPVLSDGGAFIEAGIPTAVMGTYDRVLVDTGFHSPADNLERVVFERLPEAVQILYRFIELCGADLEG